MMSGLMMVFLFIAIAYMINVVKEKDKIKEIAVTYNRLQNELYDDLTKEFEDKLEEWGAEIDRQTLSVRFVSPEILFDQGKAEIKPRFQQILKEFFPKYIRILTSEKYKNDIDEIRIEGHTSSEATGLSKDDAYTYNMRLSQDRTRSVLSYALNLNEVADQRDWVRTYLTANGLSSSKIILVDGVEDKQRSRRVEFRVRTNAERRIVKILEE